MKYPHVVRREREHGHCSLCTKEGDGPWLDVVHGTRDLSVDGPHGKHRFQRLCWKCAEWMTRMRAITPNIERRRSRAGVSFIVKVYAPQRDDGLACNLGDHRPRPGHPRIALHRQPDAGISIVCFACLDAVADAMGGEKRVTS